MVGKVIKSLSVALVLSSLTGCMWQTIDDVDIYYAKKLCDEKGSVVVSITEYWHGNSTINCKGDITEHSLQIYKNSVLAREVNDEP